MRGSLTSGPSPLPPRSPRPGQHQVATLAHEDAAVVHHHPRVEEGEVPEHVLDLALSSAVRAVDDLDNILHLQGEEC